MSFRRDGGKAYRWQRWLAEHRESLTAAGVPDWVWSEELRWMRLSWKRVAWIGRAAGALRCSHPTRHFAFGCSSCGYIATMSIHACFALYIS